MIAAGIHAHIVAWLRRIEAEEGVRVLYAAESGSRAWGFASPDSDYDVRFIYAHPHNWYLQLADTRDVIERPLDEKLVDLAGWDVRKALRLLLKSNPPLYEWLCSPIVYIDDGQFQKQAKPLFEAHASPKALAHHYYSIAQTQWRSEIDGRDQVRLKKYFYVLRPLLSLQWIAELGTAPPMQIDSLLEGSRMPTAVRHAIDDLMAIKLGMSERGTRPRVGAIDDWARERFETLLPARLSLASDGTSETHERAEALLLATLASSFDGQGSLK